MESRKEEKHHEADIEMKSAHEGLSDDAKAGDSDGTQKGSDTSLGLQPILTQQEIDNFSQIQAEAARQADQEARKEATPAREAQEPPVTIQEPSSAGASAEAEQRSEVPESACKVEFTKLPDGKYSLHVGSGCRREDLTEIGEGRAVVDRVSLECEEEWEKRYGAKSEPEAKANQGEDASLSGAGEAILTQMTITRRERFDVIPEPPEAEEKVKAKTKKKKKP